MLPYIRGHGAVIIVRRVIKTVFRAGYPCCGDVCYSGVLVCELIMVSFETCINSRV